MKAKNRFLTLLLTCAMCVVSLFVGVFMITATAEETILPEFTITNGAYIRLSTQEEIANGNQINGIRFASQMNKKYYDALKANNATAKKITLKSTVSKVVADGETAPTPFAYEWDLTQMASSDFDENGIAIFYHTINFSSLSEDELKQANAFEMQADYYIEVTTDGANPTIIKADNASEINAVRSMRQIAYKAYYTTGTEEHPNPAYKEARLKNYFTPSKATDAVYDMDVKTKALSSIAPDGVTATKVYLNGATMVDVTGKTLADIFTAEEASVSTTKELVFFDSNNVAYPVNVRFVTKIINTTTEATTFFADSTSTSSKPLTGYYLMTEDLNISVNLYRDRYFVNGTFDGDGHTLTVTVGSNHYVGLFGRIGDVTVKNLQIDMTKDFRGSSQSNYTKIQYHSLLGYLGSGYNACYFENVQLNLSRADGDTDANYSADNYPKLYIIGSLEYSTAKNLVINISDGALIYPSTTKSIQILGFKTTTNCYMYSDQYALMKANDSSWGTFGTSISSAIATGERFTPLTESKFWTLDKDAQTLTFGKVVEPEIPEEEPEDPEIPEDNTGTTYDYNPVVRFAVASDVHIRQNNNFDGVGQVDKLYSTAYAFAENSELNNGYNKLDGVFVVGDLSTAIVREELPLFFNAVKANTKSGTLSRSVMGNHEFCHLVYDSANGHSWKNEATIAQATNEFLSASGYESEDLHTVINGYHFIFVSMDRYGSSSGIDNEYVSLAKRDWLKAQLDIALADDPTGTKPIFVFQHVHVQNTVEGSSGADSYLREIFNKYPNIVDFSGHTHRPISDPRSIWQGEFTAFNTGSMAYLSNPVPELTTGARKALNDKGEFASTEAEYVARDGGLYYICEVDANNVMRVSIYDTFSNSVYGEPIYLDSFGKPSGFDYTEDRAEKSTAPTFDATDSISIEKTTFNRIDLSYPQATGKDAVSNYRIEIYENSTLVSTEYRLSGAQYGNAKPKNMSITVAGLKPSTAYTIKVYAINYYAKVSAPLVKEFTTIAMPATATPDIASITFTENGPIDAINGALTKIDNCTTSLIDDKYAGVFAKNGAYKGVDLTNWLSTIKKSFTIETYVKVTATTNAVQPLVSAKDAGGFGIDYTTAGKIAFSCYANNAKSASVSVTANINEWMHVVGVYDGSSIKLYVNGELAGTTAVDGNYLPSRYTANNLTIGANPHYVTPVYKGILYKSYSNVQMANMYSYALTAEQIQALYQNV